MKVAVGVMLDSWKSVVVVFGRIVVLLLFAG